jgi:hypothetical protein
MKEVHPHFCAEKYIAFTIATQSCDLVRRERKSPKARYINIAVVRSLVAVLPTLLESVLPSIGSAVFGTNQKFQAKQFLRRLFDQNEQSLGLFYFHPDASVSLGQSSVGYLRVAVALRAEHYPVLVQARRGRLTPEFRNKFGWLLGNLYSRVASPDWSDFSGGRREIANLIDEFLSEQTPGSGPTWIDDEIIENAMRAGVDLTALAREDLIDTLDRHRPTPRLERVVDAVVSEVSRVIELDEGTRTKIRNRLTNNGSLRKLTR